MRPKSDEQSNVRLRYIKKSALVVSSSECNLKIRSSEHWGIVGCRRERGVRDVSHPSVREVLSQGNFQSRYQIHFEFP